MTKINQIQCALKGLGGGAFQKLADSYLLKKGYPLINSIGSVPGSNKTRRGTPDTLILLDDGNYVFAEYTTVSNRVYNKLSEDIAKCLDEKSTGIAIYKIKAIVLCYTSELSPRNIDKLREQCKQAGVNIELFSLDAISYDLLGKYPGIAKEYLGIEVDSGQIVPLDEFISLYESNRLVTTLQTKFHFRVKEKDSLLSLIQNNNLIIISGKPGVGKTRIAIECCKEYLTKNNTYRPYCIFNRGIGLFEDIKSYFSDSGNFLIFVDDANHISGFQYIIQLLQTKKADQNFKIIATVRDYALDKIRKDCLPIEASSEINIKPFTDEEIKNFIKNEFKINHPLYLDRIVNISCGNPRIAVMSAKVAKDNNTLDSINDVLELYDQYYSSIKSDLNDLQNENILKVVGIVVFFRNIDITDDALMSDIKKIFGISAEDFWAASKKLHDMEVLDMFEKEVVKVSDQVLSTYLFYLVFFKEKLIDFSILISDDLFPRFEQRLIDAINPILNTFASGETMETIKGSVDKAWEQIQAKDESTFLKLIDIFCFLKPTETLIYIKKKIATIEMKDIDCNDIKFEANSNSNLYLPKFLSILSQFRFFDKKRIIMSIDLFLQYAEKQPCNTPSILHCLIDKYGFQSDSCYYDYHIQRTVISKLLKHSNSGSNEYFTRMFIALSGDYLHIYFSGSRPGRGSTIMITQFNLPPSQNLFDLRLNILKHLFNLYKTDKYKKSILDLLLNYTPAHPTYSGEIIQSDSSEILPFFSRSLDTNNCHHCIVVQQYLKLLKRFNIPVDKDLKAQFQSSDYMLYDLLTNRARKMVELKLNYDAYTAYQKKKINELTSSYSKEDYDKLFHQVFEISKTIDAHYKRQLNQGIPYILEELSIRNPDILCAVVKHYLKQGDYLEIDRCIISNLLSSLGAKKVFTILNTPKYPSKNKWLFSYYEHLSSDDIQQEHINALHNLYKKSEYCIKNLDYLLKYESKQQGFIINIVQIVLNRARVSPEFIGFFSHMFNPCTGINKKLPSIFSGKFALLEDTYITTNRDYPSADYNGRTLSIILDNDHAFINRYLAYKIARKKYLGHFNNDQDYSFIWLRDDCVDIMRRVTPFIFENERTGRCFNYYESFYNDGVNRQTDASILEKQNNYLLEEIKSDFSNNDYMVFLFSIIVGFQLQRKLIFYKSFLRKNKEFNDFKSLPINPAISSWLGSAVPMLQEKIDFYEEIKRLCNSVELLDHEQFIEQIIQETRNNIQHEKKRDFTEAQYNA